MLTLARLFFQSRNQSQKIHITLDCFFKLGSSGKRANTMSCIVEQQKAAAFSNLRAVLYENMKEWHAVRVPNHVFNVVVGEAR